MKLNLYLRISDSVYAALEANGRLISFDSYDYSKSLFDILYSRLSELDINSAFVLFDTKIEDKILENSISAASKLINGTTYYGNTNSTDVEAVNAFLKSLEIPNISMTDTAAVLFNKDMRHNSICIVASYDDYILLANTDSLQAITHCAEEDLERCVRILMSRFEIKDVCYFAGETNSSTPSLFGRLEGISDEVLEQLSLFTDMLQYTVSNKFSLDFYKLKLESESIVESVNEIQPKRSMWENFGVELETGEALDISVGVANPVGVLPESSNVDHIKKKIKLDLSLIAKIEEDMLSEGEHTNKKRTLDLNYYDGLSADTVPVTVMAPVVSARLEYDSDTLEAKEDSIVNNEEDCDTAVYTENSSDEIHTNLEEFDTAISEVNSTTQVLQVLGEIEPDEEENSAFGPRFKRWGGNTNVSRVQQDNPSDEKKDEITDYLGPVPTPQELVRVAAGISTGTVNVAEDILENEDFDFRDIPNSYCFDSPKHQMKKRNPLALFSSFAIAILTIVMVSLLALRQFYPIFFDASNTDVVNKDHNTVKQIALSVENTPDRIADEYNEVSLVYEVINYKVTGTAREYRIRTEDSLDTVNNKLQSIASTLSIVKSDDKLSSFIVTMQ